MVLAIILGRRKGYERATYRIHNIPFVVLGATILWFGWFGFNAGSALKADGLAAHAFMTSAIASASALLSWMLLDIINDRKTTLVGASTGLVIGLVAITPGAGFVPIWSSFIIGALVSPICYYGVILIKKKLKIDDALDAFGCHGIGGIWGGIATGIFGKSSINPVAKWDGLVYGEWRLFVAQIEGILITIVIAVVGTLICVAIVRIFTTLRVTDREERIGLDISQHGENAYPSFNGMIMKIDAIVREEKFEDVKNALMEIEVNGLTVSQVMGCGLQRGYKEIVRGMEVEPQMQPKIKFEIVVSSEEWAEKTIEAIKKAAYTGEFGDGKIFSYPVASATKIRTGETGYDAVQCQE